MRKAIFPGSFDPFTIGHLDIVARALKMFDAVVVGIGVNIHKAGAQEAAQRRAEMIARLFNDFPQVEVVCYEGLTAEFAQTHGITAMIRGVRNSADFDYEQNLAATNMAIFPAVETILIPCRPELGIVSSSMVRELQCFGKDISKWIPTMEDVKSAITYEK